MYVLLPRIAVLNHVRYGTIVLYCNVLPISNNLFERSDKTDCTSIIRYDRRVWYGSTYKKLIFPIINVNVIKA